MKPIKQQINALFIELGSPFLIVFRFSGKLADVHWTPSDSGMSMNSLARLETGVDEA
jgi:hypothetical protein